MPALRGVARVLFSSIDVKRHYSLPLLSVRCLHQELGSDHVDQVISPSHCRSCLRVGTLGCLSASPPYMLLPRIIRHFLSNPIATSSLYSTGRNLLARPAPHPLVRSPVEKRDSYFSENNNRFHFTFTIYLLAFLRLQVSSPPCRGHPLRSRSCSIVED